MAFSLMPRKQDGGGQKTLKTAWVLQVLSRHCRYRVEKKLMSVYELFRILSSDVNIF